jgi:hypothetical protein
MGKGSAGREARRARLAEEARERKVSDGARAIRGMFDQKFNQFYYDQKQAEQKAQYMDEFGTQWEKARKGLEAALMRQGIYDSTEGATRMQAARDERDKREEDINQRALATVQGQKGKMIAAQDAVIGQLRSSSDLNAANAAAAQQLAYQSQPIPYSPLGSVFTDFTAGLAEQAQQERQGTNRYNLGISRLFNNGNRYTQNVG